MRVEMSTRPGKVVPEGRELALALTAGVLWVLAVALLVPYPEHLRRGILDVQDGVPSSVTYGLAQLRLLGALCLLALAHVLSARGHGTAFLVMRLAGMRVRTVVPRCVLVARVLTWLAVTALVVGGFVAEGLVSPTDCFRTCAPFPR